MIRATTDWKVDPRQASVSESQAFVQEQMASQLKRMSNKTQALIVDFHGLVLFASGKGMPGKMGDHQLMTS